MTKQYVRTNASSDPITQRYRAEILTLVYEFATDKMKLYGPKPDPWFTGKLIKKGAGEIHYGKRYDKNKYRFFFCVMMLATYHEPSDGAEYFERLRQSLISVKDAYTFGSAKGQPAAFRHTKTFVNRLLQINKPGPKPDSVREKAVEFIVQTGPSCGWKWRPIYESAVSTRIPSPWPQSWEQTKESTIKSFIFRCKKNYLYACNSSC